MTDFIYLSTVIAVLALATFATRILPFVMLHKVSDHPLLRYLGQYLPAMIMVLLIIYSFKQEDLFSIHFLPELACLVTVAVLHLCFKQTLLSIILGTALFMLLTHLGY